MDSSELKTEIDSWNLQSDVKLLEYLQAFSGSIADKTNALATKVEELTGESVEADVKLRNTLNEFLMLANNQFIENVNS